MNKKSRNCLSALLVMILLFSNSYNISATPIENYMWIDTPISGSTISYSDVLVKGWALNNSGIKQVDIYLDGAKIGQATYGGYRPDVNKVVPGYVSGNNSGYNYIINKEKISLGKHQIKVVAVGNNGLKTEKVTEITMIQKPNYMWIDSPVNGAVLNYKDIDVRGWALNSSGIKQVDIYLDGSKIGQATYGGYRPDVNKVVPGYISGDNSGYEYSIKKESISKGIHEIKVITTGNDNTIAFDIKKFSVVKKENYMWLDYPINGSQTNDSDILVKGWSLNGAGIKQIDLYMDSKLIGQASYGLYRPDVSKMLPGYDVGANSGYSYTIKKESISPGKHEIKVISIGNDNTSLASISQINMVKKPSYMWIDYPINNSKISNSNVNIVGWALNPSTVASIDISVDGKVVGQATYGILRQDVNRVVPGYPSGDYSGFTYTIDSNSINDGVHNIEVNVKGKDGTSNIESRTITFKKLENKLVLETPTENFISNNKNISVSGYALIPSGIKNIEVFVDDIKVGEGTFGILRDDISAANPEYPGGKNSGYTFNIPVDNLKPGTHNLTIKANGQDNSVTTDSANFTINKVEPLMWIDAPINSNSYYMEDILVSGWAINSSGVKQINIYLNDKLIGSATKGLSRLDVNKMLSNYRDSLNSGYSFTIPKSLLSTLDYNIKVEIIGNDGTVQSSFVNIKVDMDKYSYISTNYNITLDSILLKQILVNPQTYVSGIGWTTAKTEDIKYYLDPINFKDDETKKYEFLVLNYAPGITLEEVNAMLVNKGALGGHGQAYVNASISNNISLAYAVSHSLLETGNGTSYLSRGILVSEVDGKPVEPKIVYNMFGVGAYDGDPNRYGSEYAYKQGWFSVDSSIEGGIAWISKGYINNQTYKQNTLYKMRWNPFNPSTHQYATDIKWAISQTSRMKSYLDIYQNAKLIFDIPVYK